MRTVLLVTVAACLAAPACREEPSNHEGRSVSGERLALLDPAARNALESARVAIRENDADPEAHGRLAMLFHAHGFLDAAASSYERAQALAPDDANWYRLDALRAAEAGEEAEALAKARRAVARDTESVAARTTLGGLELRGGRLEESRAHFEAALGREPESLRALSGMATVEFRSGNFARSLVFAERALAVAPDDPATHYTAALARERQGDRERAREHLDASRRGPARRPAIEPPPEILALRGGGARGALAAGTELLERGRYHEAVLALREAVQLDPGSADAQNALGAALEQVGDLQEARHRFEQAASLDPGLAVVRVNLGVLLGRLGDFDVAVEHLETAAQLDPGQANPWSALGAALEAQGRVAEAVAAYRAAVSRDPELQRAQLRLGVLLGEAGQLAEAVSHLREAVALTPDSGEAHHVLAVGLLRLGDFPEALAHERRAIALAEAAGDGDLLGTARYTLGLLLRESGEFGEALWSFEAARAEFPENTDVLSELAHTHHLAGDHGAAIRMQHRVVAARPADAEAYYRLGVFFAASGDPTAARTAFEESLRMEPGFVPATEAIARLDRKR